MASSGKCLTCMRPVADNESFCFAFEFASLTLRFNPPSPLHPSINPKFRHICFSLSSFPLSYFSTLFLLRPSPSREPRFLEPSNFYSYAFLSLFRHSSNITSKSIVLILASVHFVPQIPKLS